MLTQEYRRTDLAIENQAVVDRLNTEGVSYQDEREGSVSVFTVNIQNQVGEKALGRKRGTYVTLSFGKLWEEDKETRSALVHSLSRTVERFFANGIDTRRLLVVGLGNRGITADAIGPLVSDRIEATGHWESEPALKAFLPDRLLFSISPGVIGKTGIETLAQVRAAVSASKATCVLAIDALAALSVDRLCRTVQLTDSGIVPGSGVGNHRCALNRETLGVPVIAIGVPAVVSSSAVIMEALEKAGHTEISEALRDLLENNRSFFVTLKDCDLATEALAEAISSALNALSHPRIPDSKTE